MSMPSGIGIVDTMIGFPHPDLREVYAFITRQTRDQESRQDFQFPVEYMFKDVPEKQLTGSADPVAVTIEQMDSWGIERGLVSVDDNRAWGNPQSNDTLTASFHRSRATPTTGWPASGGSSSCMRPSG
jgi:hypothetical protein